MDFMTIVQKLVANADQLTQPAPAEKAPDLAVANRSRDRRHMRCSVCGKPQDQVRKLVAGP